MTNESWTGTKKRKKKWKRINEGRLTIGYTLKREKKKTIDNFSIFRFI